MNTPLPVCAAVGGGAFITLARVRQGVLALVPVCVIYFHRQTQKSASPHGTPQKYPRILTEKRCIRG
jgi:hypothetical protein